MFSDTHFHYHYLAEKYGIAWGAELFSQMARNNTSFALDIGTSHDDLLPRLEYVKESLNMISDASVRQKSSAMLSFAAGIWPDEESIRKREERVSYLAEQIEIAKNSSLMEHPLAAIGECGLDHHWNPSGTDKRNQEHFDSKLFEGELELFTMQLNLAQKLSLPVIVHSREAFEDTLSCIDRTGYNRGIIHCFSYGKAEAKAFLDRGWYIALGGAVTYTKKRLMEEMYALINYIPDDRLLLETDAPYLAPVPCRGQTNTPLLIQHTYDFIASAKNITTEDLCTLVDENCKSLFNFLENSSSQL